MVKLDSLTSSISCSIFCGKIVKIATKKLIKSITNNPVNPINGNSAPAINGASIFWIALISCIKPFALGMSFFSTRSGIVALNAGFWNVPKVCDKKVNGYTIHTFILPVASKIISITLSTASSESVNTIICFRCFLSAIDPAKGANIIPGKIWTKNVIAKVVALFVIMKIHNDNPNDEIPDPSIDTNCPNHTTINFLNFSFIRIPYTVISFLLFS